MRINPPLPKIGQIWNIRFPANETWPTNEDMILLVDHSSETGRWTCYSFTRKAKIWYSMARHEANTQFSYELICDVKEE